MLQKTLKRDDIFGVCGEWPVTALPCQVQVVCSVCLWRYSSLKETCTLTSLGEISQDVQRTILFFAFKQKTQLWWTWSMHPPVTTYPSPWRWLQPGKALCFSVVMCLRCWREGPVWRSNSASTGQQDENLATQSPLATLLPSHQHTAQSQLFLVPDDHPLQPMERLDADAAVAGVVHGGRLPRLCGPLFCLPIRYAAAAAANHSAAATAATTGFSAQTHQQGLQILPAQARAQALLPASVLITGAKPAAVNVSYGQANGILYQTCHLGIFCRCVYRPVGYL